MPREVFLTHPKSNLSMLPSPLSYIWGLTDQEPWSIYFSQSKHSGSGSLRIFESSLAFDRDGWPLQYE
ncbi:uncharacterized protein METZ01_LOCUS346641 [marine metagenome]|uniref:Uncharacterized protein n=1 Tax=marine metagenome TaxID=408172 RepID=A0A382R9G0_9ZZZZ